MSMVKVLPTPLCPAGSQGRATRLEPSFGALIKGGCPLVACSLTRSKAKAGLPQRGAEPQVTRSSQSQAAATHSLISPLEGEMSRRSEGRGGYVRADHHIKTRPPGPTPLCPAGHLPLKGGDHLGANSSTIFVGSKDYRGKTAVTFSSVWLACSSLSPRLRTHGRSRRGANPPSLRPPRSRAAAPRSLISPPEGEMSRRDRGGYARAEHHLRTRPPGPTPLCPAGHLPLRGGDQLGAPSPCPIAISTCGKSSMASRPSGSICSRPIGRPVSNTATRPQPPRPPHARAAAAGSLISPPEGEMSRRDRGGYADPGHRPRTRSPGPSPLRPAGLWGRATRLDRSFGRRLKGGDQLGAPSPTVARRGPGIAVFDPHHYPANVISRPFPRETRS
ncbi:hypothetical protein J2Z17_003353 [Rhizobium halophytocola]|uniref:Uncharacterized protein n=1 Tax=Rhizobium halophytocola TaxID=735519 RepID=A0ABS4E1U6_9HYPH|nr:hypothetical protein [Rhizobium halophytocola]